MAEISCTDTDLAGDAKCYCGMTERQMAMAELYALLTIAGLDPEDLATLQSLTKCYCGMTDRQLELAKNAALCQIVTS